jgi:hypothetical protein
MKLKKSIYVEVVKMENILVRYYKIKMNPKGNQILKTPEELKTYYGYEPTLRFAEYAPLWDTLSAYERSILLHKLGYSRKFIWRMFFPRGIRRNWANIPVGYREKIIKYLQRGD